MNILVTRIYFILIITWSLAYGCGQQRNGRNKKCRQIDDDFDDHAYAAVQRGVHSLIEQKIAQAQQIWSIILQHHEST